MSENLQIFAPKNFSEYVGQEKAKAIASVMVGAAKKENRALPNTMIDGSYGLGKTSLAKVIAEEIGIKPKIIDAASLNKEVKLTSKLTIVDEIHNLDASVADSLNILMDAGTIRIIGCTTNPGMLPAAFRSRFRTIHLDHYTVWNIRQIIDLACLRKGVPINGATLAEIAKRSRLNPRVALNHLSFIFDLMSVQNQYSPTVKLAKSAFTMLDVDDNGYNARDYAYMRAFPSDGRPVGIKALEAVTGIDAKTIEAEIEPYLLQTGKIDRLPRGRIKVAELK